MRLVWITPGFVASEEDTDAVPYLQAFALALKQAHIDLHIIALEYPFTSKCYEWKGIRVYPCNGQNRPFRKAGTFYKAARHVWQLCSDHPHVVLHTFWWDWKMALTEGIVWLLRQYGKWRKKPARYAHFCTLMGQEVRSRKHSILLTIARQMQKRLVAVSLSQNEFLMKSAGFRAGHVIEWGIAEEDILREEQPLRDLDIVGAGSLNAVKNWPLWIETVQQVRRQKHDVKALLVGKGPERDVLEKKIIAAGLENNVFLHPSPSRPAALAAMRRAKVLLHTADYEGFGYVLAEAAAQGCRVVSTPGGIASALAACGHDADTLALETLNALQSTAPYLPVVPYKAVSAADRYLCLFGQTL